ncbi:MAG TPA: 4-hydroxyphenylacetate catabolism regulatory protein HpaA [Rhodocyclaceae bacterium]|nr:4-hydroxyphenylacetate catabolism regulatory protein HpaA [Rhodocyclaceae bacterium]
MASSVQAIPDIHIGRVYDQRDPECEIHYETFGRLADFFGRNTPAHRHYCFFQVHVLVRGSIRLNLDDRAYCGQAPLVIFTPPTVPHAFYTEEDTDGHVLTVRQEVVRAWFQLMPGQWPESLLREPAFFELGVVAEEGRWEFDALLQTVGILQREFNGDRKGRSAAVLALGQSAFINLSRLLLAQGSATALRPERSEDLQLFLRFCDMIEAHFRDHLTLSEYALRLSMTEARLNDICRRMAARSSKEVVHERLLQEARRLLRFSAMPVGEISYQLGFADPGYFSRFFTKRTGVPPSQFRSGGQS